MTYPALEVAFAPGVASSSVPAGGDWVDITDRCLGFTTKHGREDEFDQPGAGTLEIELDNADGALDPDNASGPYYGDLLPLVWFRVRGGDSSVDTDVFYGQVSINGFQIQASQFVGQMVVQGSVLDMLEQLANTDLPSSVYAIDVAADDPDAWWRLDESSGTVATDSSGNGYHREFDQGVTFNSRSGLIENDDDNALLIDPGRMSLPRPSPAVRSDWDFTVEGWVDVPDETTYDGTIWRQSDHGETAPGGTVTSVFVGYQAAALSAYPYVEIIVAGSSAADGAYRIASSPLSAGVHHIAAYIPAQGAAVPAGIKLYVDGAAVTGTTGGALGTLPVFPTNMLYEDAGSDSTLDEIAVYDGELSAARVLAHYEAGTDPWAGERTDERVTQLFDAGGVDPAAVTIGTGVSTMPAATLATDLLSALQDAARAEDGLLYVDHHDEGKVRFRGRHAQWTETRSITSQATFGDGAGEVTYVAADIADDRIVNAATVQRAGGANITVEDAASITQYQRRTYSETGLLIESDAEAESRAQRIVAERKDRRRRVRSVTLQPADSAHPAWAHVFAREIGDRVTVKWRPPYGGTYTFPAIIEGISHTWRPSSNSPWSTTFYLSPVPYGATAEPYFIVGTSTIDGPARIGY